MTSFNVQAEELTAHASHLDGLTDRLDTAISAAETVSMSDEAYGLLCSFLPPIVNPMEEEGAKALKAAKEGVTLTADNVRSTARDYQDTDDANAKSLKPFDEAVEVNQSAVALRGVPAVGDGGGAPQQQGTPVMEPQQRATPVLDQVSPVVEPQEQASPVLDQVSPVVEPQQQAVSPAMQVDLLAEPLRPMDRGTPA